jgi:RES domain-containing protein
VRLTGFVYRAHNPRWAFAPDSGQGAAAAGGRFNPVGMLALYTALRFETAWLEAQQAFPFKAQPMTLCGYDVDCEDVLDLTDTATLAAHRITATDLACAWKDLSTRGIKPPSWEIAARLSLAGTAGIIVPSFARGAGAADVNVVLWDWAPDPPHQVRVIDDEQRLPRDASSWRETPGTRSAGVPRTSKPARPPAPH